MKKLKILIPSLIATTSMPFISLTSCELFESKKVKHTITFSAGDHGTIEEGKETIVVEGDKTKFGDIEKPTVTADEAHGWFFDHWDYDDSYEIKDDVTVTALYQDLSDYVIDLDNIESILGMEGVEYMQLDGTEIISGDPTDNELHITNQNQIIFSPTVCHTTQIMEMNNHNYDSYLETFIYEQIESINDPVYLQILRSSPQGSFSDPAEVPSSQFNTPAKYGSNMLLKSYQLFLSYEGKLTFDTNNLCYKGEVGDPDSSFYMAIEYYFNKNQLVQNKIHIIADTINTNDDTIEQTFTYEQVTPDVPV
mgnify:CR=1 FL=1